MKRTLYAWTLSAAAVAACADARAQTNVYSLNIVSYVNIPMANQHIYVGGWMGGSATFPLGYSEFQQGNKPAVQTFIYLGSFSIDLPARAGVLAVFGVLGVSLLSWLAGEAWLNLEADDCNRFPSKTNLNSKKK